MPSWRKTTLTILIGQTASEELDLTDGLGVRRVKSITFFSPATLPETVTVHVAPQAGGTYQALQSGGTDFTLPANKATLLTGFTVGALKLVASVAVASGRVFTLRGAAEGVITA